jgi:hypothetical protein
MVTHFIFVWIDFSTSRKPDQTEYNIYLFEIFWDFIFQLNDTNKRLENIIDPTYTFMDNWIDEIFPIAVILVSLSSWPLFDNLKIKI